MSQLKALLIVLLVLRVLPRLDGYRYRSVQPNNWHYLSNLYNDAGGDLYSSYDRFGRSPADGGGGSGGGGGGGPMGDGDGGGGGGGGGGGSTEVGRTCGKPSSRCGANLGRGDPKATASGFAQRAAQEAKAASDAQAGAAEAASYQVKCELAAKAIQSAKAAEAVLAGKQQILDQLRREMAEAEAEVAGLTMSLRNIQENAESAAQTVQETQAQLNHLKSIVQAAAANLNNIQNVSKGAQLELAEKTQILKAAQHRAENLGRQMADAKADFEKTKVAAYKAVCAAVEAKQKAQRSRRMSWMYSDLGEQL